MKTLKQIKIRGSCLLKMFFVAVGLACTAFGAENITVSGSQVSAKEVVERLFIQAFRYKIVPSPKNLASGYFIQFEQWNMGQLKRTKKTKVFELDPREKDPSFFISLPTGPDLDVCVTPSGMHGEFRGNLEFPLSAKGDDTHATITDFLEKATIEHAEKGMSVVIAYQINGINDLEWSSEKLHEVKAKTEKEKGDPLSVALKACLDTLTRVKLEKVDVIVFRLIFE